MTKRPVTVTRPPSALMNAVRFFGVVVSAAACGALLVEAEARDLLLEAFFACIAATFGLGVLAAFLGLAAQDRETKRQRRLVEHLTGKELFSALDDYEGPPSKSLFLLRSLQKQHRLSPTSTNADPLLDSMERQLSLRASQCAILGATAASIGFLGTVAGMTEMISSLEAVASQGTLMADAEGGPALFAALFGDGGPLQGLNTAFLTTLAGLAATIVLRLLAASIEANAAAITDYLADLVARDIGPGSNQAGWASAA